jgi:hypothetical protein
MLVWLIRGKYYAGSASPSRRRPVLKRFPEAAPGVVKIAVFSQ